MFFSNFYSFPIKLDQDKLEKIESEAGGGGACAVFEQNKIKNARNYNQSEFKAMSV